MIVSGLGSGSPICTPKGTWFDSLSPKPLPHYFLVSLQLPSIPNLPPSPSHPLTQFLTLTPSPTHPPVLFSASPFLPLSPFLPSPSPFPLSPDSLPPLSVSLPPPECMAAIGWSLWFECSHLASGWRWCGSTAPHAPSPCRLSPGRSKVGGASRTTKKSKENTY